MQNRRGAFLPGLLLILLGAWLLATTLGVRLPDLSQLWPVVPLFFGLAALVQYFAEGRRSEGLVFIGVAAALLGALLSGHHPRAAGVGRPGPLLAGVRAHRRRGFPGAVAGAARRDAACWFRPAWPSRWAWPRWP